MKITKSELQKIINEELQNVLIEEGFMQDLGTAAKATWGGAKDIGREFAKGAMGSEEGDNPISKGIHRAYGVRLPGAIDKLMGDTLDRLEDLASHPEGDKVDDAFSNAPDPQAQYNTVEEFRNYFRDEVVQQWGFLTNPIRTAP